ncbi:MAG: putative ABC transporter permease [Clostridiales bacterium]|nr:putative ABC transporter permease [Clostridiales bacterium]
MELGKLKRTETIFLIFVIGSIIGWIYEEIFYYFQEGHIVDRGFMTGPWLPIYGIGAVVMILALKWLKQWPPLVFVFGMLLTGILEWGTGAFIMQVWHKRMWDYTGLFMNIGGFVCLRSVLTFAIGGIALIYFIEPFVEKCMYCMKAKTANIIAGVFLVIMIVDLVHHILTV